MVASCSSASTTPFCGDWSRCGRQTSILQLHPRRDAPPPPPRHAGYQHWKALGVGLERGTGSTCPKSCWEGAFPKATALYSVSLLHTSPDDNEAQCIPVAPLPSQRSRLSLRSHTAVGSRGWFFLWGRYSASSQTAVNAALMVFSAPSFLLATGSGQVHGENWIRGFEVRGVEEHQCCSPSTALNPL